MVRPLARIPAARSRRLGGGQVRDVDVATSRRSDGSARTFAASRRSRCSRSRWRRSSRRPRRAGSRGTGRSAGRASCRRSRGDRRPLDVDPGAAPGALGDRLDDQHLVVAVGEGRIGGPRRRPAGDDIGVDRPGRAPRTCRRSPRRGRRGAPTRPARPATSAPAFLNRISLGRSRWPSQIWSGSSESQAIDDVRAVDLPLERVLPARADLRDADRAAGAALEAEQDRRGVLGADLAGDGLGRALGSRTSRPARSAPGGRG